MHLWLLFTEQRRLSPFPAAPWLPMNSEQCFEACLALHSSKTCLCLVLHFTFLLSGFCYLQLQPDLLICALHRKRGKKPQTPHPQTLEGSSTTSTNIWGHAVKSQHLNSKKTPLRCFQRPCFEFAAVQKLHKVRTEQTNSLLPPPNAMLI